MSRNMAEDKATEEDEKVLDAVTQEEPKSEEAESKDGFIKDDETVKAAKYNQAVRKQRELELENRELKKLKDSKDQEAPAPKEEEKKEEEDFFKETEAEPKVDPAKLIDEKLKPVMDSFKKREANDKRIARDAFFARHPKYLNDAKAWQGLLDEMDASLNPNSPDDYYTQLEKTDRILSGEAADSSIEQKKKDIAGDAASSGDGAEKADVKEEFTAEDRKHQKMFNVSDEGMRAFKEKQKSGSLRILT